MTIATRTKLAQLLRAHAQGLLSDHDLFQAVCELTYQTKGE